MLNWVNSGETKSVMTPMVSSVPFLSHATTSSCDIRTSGLHQLEDSMKEDGDGEETNLDHGLDLLTGGGVGLGDGLGAEQTSFFGAEKDEKVERRAGVSGRWTWEGREKRRTSRSGTRREWRARSRKRGALRRWNVSERDERDGETKLGKSDVDEPRRASKIVTVPDPSSSAVERDRIQSERRLKRMLRWVSYLPGQAATV